MPYKIIWEAHGVIKRFSGQVDTEELLRAGTDTEADPRFDNYRYVINDFLDCTGFSLSSPVVDEIAAIDWAASRANARIRIAVVATAPEIIEATRQYAASPLNVYPTRIFATMAQARAWLDTPL